ncbi:fatty-acid amide hydrolase 2-B-like [Macrobrachium rosenbergii]|uniref:fatty-acid amide hydrolase 2-B-like n=1 Tax=Macrobrachium rosenbergii TaxID=79674 RepID=UPI0034D77E9B
MVLEDGIVMFLLRPFLRLARRLWDYAVTLLFFVLKGWRRKTPLPPVFNPTLMHSAVDLARYIREGKMSSVEVVRAYITRVSDVNPVLNAITQESFKAALLQARRVDEMLNKGLKDGTLTVEMLERRRPFLGVPFTVKETIAVAGFPHTGGLVAREGLLSPSDAYVVAKMKKAGAILLGTTNVSELGMWWESDNKVYGRTNNPYDTRRTPGGSSGGEAALMCACGTPLSIGTDSGGSLRIPAFFCGLFSHKPTNGIVSVQGCNVHHHSQYSELQSAGPISRHARDLSPVLAVLAGDRVSQLSLSKRVDPGRLKIYTMENDGDEIWCTRPSRELVAVQRAVAHHFRHTYDITVRKVNIPGMKYSYRIWQEKMKEEFMRIKSRYMSFLDSQGEINLWTEIMRSLLGRARHTVPSLAQAALDKLVGEITFLKQQKRVLQGKEDAPLRQISINDESLNKALHMKIQRLLGEDGVLLYPSHPTLAPYHSESFFRPFNFVYTAIFNALGFPVTQVPLGLSPSGIPLGIQVVGGMYQDHITIAVAQDLETAFGGWVCPSKIL